MNWFIAAVILASLIILILPLFLINKENLKKMYRWKQARFIPAALLYGIAFCILSSLLKDQVGRIFQISGVMTFIQTYIISDKISYAVTLFTVVIINAALLIGFIFIKLFFRIRMNKKQIPDDADWKRYGSEKTLSAVYWQMLNMIYSLHERTAFLRVQFVRIKHTLKYFVYIISGLYLGLIVFLEILLFYAADWIPFAGIEQFIRTVYLYPVVSGIIISELIYFLDGNEEHDSFGKIVREKSNKNNNADYSELEAEYKRIFKGRYITTLDIKDNSPKLLTNETQIDNHVIESIKQNLKYNNFDVNSNFITFLKNISDGKDVIMDSTVYSEFGEYLYRYLNVLLSRGEKILFVCPDNRQMDQLCDYTEERLKNINGYHLIWKIKKFAHNLTGKNIDILFITAQSVQNDDIFSNAFFETISTVIIPNVTETIAKNNLQLSLLKFKLSGLTSIHPARTKKVQYICLSEGVPIGIRKSLLDTLHLSDHIVGGNTNRTHGNTKIMLWRYEDPDVQLAQKALFDGTLPCHLGVDLPLAIIALKYNVDIVSIFSRFSTPHRQILDNINNNRLFINQYIDTAQTDLNNQIIFNRYNNENKYTRFTVIDDELNNLPMTIYNSANLSGTDTTMIHIVSKPYMLRDYYFANAEKYTQNELTISMFMPIVTDSFRLSVFKLLYDLEKTGVPENTIVELVSQLTDLTCAESSQRIEAALKFCLKIAGKKDIADSVYNHFLFYKDTVFDSENDDFETYYLVKFKDKNIINNFVKLNEFAKLQIYDVTHTANFFADGIFQRYLPGQYMIYNGYVYLIKSIDKEKNTLVLVNGPDDCKIPSGYTQIRNYSVNNTSRTELDRQIRNFNKAQGNIVESFALGHFRCPVTVDTSGYYVHEMTGEHFKQSGITTVNSANTRKYDAASVLSLKITGDFNADTDKAAFLMAVVMNEFFKTWFPYSHSCIAVCPVLKNPEAVYNNYIHQLYPQMTLSQNPENIGNYIELYIIEDSKTDLGIVQSLMSNWQDMFRRIFENFREYLNWQQTYDGETNENISNNYLYFGNDSEPQCFDFKTLTRIINEISGERYSGTVSAGESQISVKGHCSFCGTALQVVQYDALDDGRIMCARCASLIVTDMARLETLFRDAVMYLYNEFNVEIAEDITVRFATAESIRKRMKTGDRREVLGFADPNNRELWVESDSPATNLSEIIIHELTHFWQFDNIVCNNQEYMEGHSSFVEIQYLRYLKENTWADRREGLLEQRGDVYGKGFRQLKKELTERGDLNSFTYMKELFSE